MKKDKNENDLRREIEAGISEAEEFSADSAAQSAVSSLMQGVQFSSPYGDDSEHYSFTGPPDDIDIETLKEFGFENAADYFAYEYNQSQLTNIPSDVSYESKPEAIDTPIAPPLSKKEQKRLEKEERKAKKEAERLEKAEKEKAEREEKEAQRLKTESTDSAEDSTNKEPVPDSLALGTIESKMIKDHEQKKKKQKRAGIIAASAVSLALIGYGAVAFSYQDRFCMGTKINGVDCSSCTTEQAQEKLFETAKNYSLEIVAADGSVQSISGDSFGLRLNSTDGIEEYLKNQNSLLWGKTLIKGEDLEVPSIVEYNKDLLYGEILKLDSVNNPEITKSENAKVSYNEDSKEFEITDEISGNEVDVSLLFYNAAQAANSLAATLDLRESGSYVAPKYSADSEETIEAQRLANEYLGNKVTYKFGDSAQEVVDNEKTKDWIVVSDEMQVFFDGEKVKEYVSTLKATYDTQGKTRTFTTGYGYDVLVSGGNYGWKIDLDAEVNDLVASLKGGGNEDKKPIYAREAAQYGENDIGGTYAEVDLTGQHMFLFVDGKKVLECDVVTGKPSTGNATPAGTFGLTYKQKNAILRGEDYETPVAYWMPFNGDIGFHDATWQSAFGGNRYLTHGSHGCVNMPLGMAGKLIEYVYVNMPVICYHANDSTIIKDTLVSSTTQATAEVSTQTTTQTTTEATTEATTAVAAESTTEATTEEAEITTEAVAEEETVLSEAPAEITTAEEIIEEVIIDTSSEQITTI